MRIIRFTTSTCGPCRMTRRTWEKMASSPDYPEIEFIEAMVDTNPEFASLRDKYNVNRTPTHVFVDEDGNELDRFEGYLSELMIKNLIEDVREKIKK